MKIIDHGVVYEKGQIRTAGREEKQRPGRPQTLSEKILRAHTVKRDDDLLHIRFDSLAMHDITYVNILQTARASGLEQFPLPVVLTNCHNSLCAVGGTINEDDHQFALSAARRYGGIYVPPCLAVIHSYNREEMSGCGRMILASDSHTRYGALGTMGIGEGGGELVKQLLEQTYDLAMPEIILVHVTGRLRPGTGPQDAALALVEAVYASGFVRNKVLEFAGEGIHSLSQDERNGIDVMTTETTCLSSIWETDGETQKYFALHQRPDAYQELKVAEGTYYDGAIELNLDEIEPMIALPMHPSCAVPIRLLKADPEKYFRQTQERIDRQMGGRVHLDLLSKIDGQGRIHVDQGIIAGCSGGTYENICAAAGILRGQSCGSGEFKLSLYPDSMPTYKALMENGTLSTLVEAGAVIREAFCGPCFGAGETPANGEFSIRHSTRNFPNREGSKPAEGQIAGVGLMDARSIAATAARQGILTGADELCHEPAQIPPYVFDEKIYAHRVYNGWGHPEKDTPLRYGPNIKDWPDMPALSEDLLLGIVSYIDDPVTTTDELIPSGETSSYRSNPLRLAEFALSRRDPAYVGEAKKIAAMDKERLQGSLPLEVRSVYDALRKAGLTADAAHTEIGSAIYANKPGDGSAREQAASCQRVLGGCANIASQYATKRYRTNCINWGMLPFTTKEAGKLAKGDWIFVRGIRTSLEKEQPVSAWVIHPSGEVEETALELGELNSEERKILLAGSLINYNRQKRKK